MSEPEARELEAMFRPVIEAEIAELTELRAASKGDRAPVELDQQSIGRVSRIDSMQVQAMSQAAEARRQLRMRVLEGALARLGGEEFGYCSECGEFIGLQRLKIDPAALRCIGCAS
ncbi:MAG: TraR/DksA family transcriptional regulator [Ferrovibrio sp.]